jgi:hypothetical protein
VKRARDRRTVTVDIEHMRRLHQEATEQLELMRTVLEAAELATGTMHDSLDQMVLNHWNCYLDVMHMIAMHDEQMAASLRNHGMTARDDDIPDPSPKQPFDHRLLQSFLSALTRRHRRFWDIYGWRGNPMNDYLKESMIMEREHIAELMSTVQTIL